MNTLSDKCELLKAMEDREVKIVENVLRKDGLHEYFFKVSAVRSDWQKLADTWIDSHVNPLSPPPGTSFPPLPYPDDRPWEQVGDSVSFKFEDDGTMVVRVVFRYLTH